MSLAIIKERLFSYNCTSLEEQEHALKEIAQEIALMSLSKSDFFKIASFQGGTCLRILHGLHRFSEDLDFVLDEADSSFTWDVYIRKMADDFRMYGYELEVVDRSKINNNVKKAFIKANSMGGLLVLKDSRTNIAKIKIKLEIDTNPPVGSEYETKFLDFPMPYSVRCQNLPSLFASKCHALLCRKFEKGRDWYDLIWYVQNKVPPNLNLLKNALTQAGPWKNKPLKIDGKWLVTELSRKTNTLNWDFAKRDVARLLKPEDRKSIEVWSVSFFDSIVAKITKSYP